MSKVDISNVDFNKNRRIRFTYTFLKNPIIYCIEYDDGIVIKRSGSNDECRYDLAPTPSYKRSSRITKEQYNLIRSNEIGKPMSEQDNKKQQIDPFDINCQIVKLLDGLKYDDVMTILCLLMNDMILYAINEKVLNKESARAFIDSLAAGMKRVLDKELSNPEFELNQ